MSLLSDYVNRFIPDENKRRKLKDDITDQDFVKIAEDMVEWEEKLAGPFEMTEREIKDIHEEGKSAVLKRSFFQRVSTPIYCLLPCQIC